MTFKWNPIAGGTADTWVFFELENSDENLIFESPFPGEDGSLSGLSTSLTIPPDTLAFGETYTARLSVVNIVDESSDYPGADAIAGYQTFLNLEIQTNGPDNTPPNLIRSAPYWGDDSVTTNSIITFEFDEPMDQSVDPADAITWVNVNDPGNFSYRWSPGGEILFCHFVPGLPTDNPITWYLNEEGSPAKLRDLAGNDLISNTHQGEFITDSSSNSGNPDVLRIELYKAKEFRQTGNTPTDLDSYFGDFLVDFSGISTISSVDLDVPGAGLAEDVGEFEDDFLGIEGDGSFSSVDDLNDAFPAGDYDLILHTFHDGERTVTLNPGSGEFPAAPTILEFSTTQEWDSTRPFTITWNPMPGGTSADAIFFYVEGDNDDFFETPCLGEPGALDGTATSVTIPANTLPPGSTLKAELAFAKVNTNDTTQYPGVRSSAALASLTLFEIQTTGEPFVPRIGLTKTPTHTKVKVTGEHGQFFDVQASNDLIDWNFVGSIWLGDDREGFLGSGTLEDYSDPGANLRFYRIETLEPE
ncbi:Ig-like domain-containing protein [bacterium]|nr:Ig-like domain-containing protein [bacterium]